MNEESERRGGIPLLRAMSRLADLLILNLLFLVSCLPVVTIGPAAAALYSVAFTIGTQRENGIIKPYLKAFRENFLTALKLWLILLAVGGMLVLDFVLVSNFDGAVGSLNTVFGALLLLELMASNMIFPLISLFRNTVFATIKNGIILSLGNLPRAAAAMVIWAFPVFLLLRFPLVFFGTGIIWVMIYFSGAAYLCGLMFRKAFAPFLPEDTFKAETEE